MNFHDNAAAASALDQTIDPTAYPEDGAAAVSIEISPASISSGPVIDPGKSGD